MWNPSVLTSIRRSTKIDGFHPIHNNRSHVPTTFAKFSNPKKMKDTAILLTTLMLSRTVKADSIIPTPKVGFQLKSGVKYFDLVEGTGPTPRYGQMVCELGWITCELFHYLDLFK
jgi:hypothetical protein